VVGRRSSADDRRRDALATVALRRKSTKPCADDELRYWRGVLRSIDLQAARLRLQHEPSERPANDGADDWADDDRRGQWVAPVELDPLLEHDEPEADCER
jgi:hypothetical protein